MGQHFTSDMHVGGGPGSWEWQDGARFRRFSSSTGLIRPACIKPSTDVGPFAEIETTALGRRPRIRRVPCRALESKLSIEFVPSYVLTKYVQRFAADAVA